MLQDGAQEQQEAVRAVRQTGEAVVARVHHGRAADAARHLVPPAARGHRPRTESSHLDLGDEGTVTIFTTLSVKVLTRNRYEILPPTTSQKKKWIAKF